MSARVPHAPSWYAATAHPAPERPALAGDVDCDVCVVGGGIAGCSTALHLAERGFRVVLLEQHRIGWGASGRSGGQAIFGVAAGEAKLEQLLGLQDSKRIFDVTVAALALVRERISRHRIACDWRDGQMHVGLKPRHDRELAEWAEHLERVYGYEGLQLLSRDEVRERIASERYTSALFDPRSGHLHPLNYTLGLAAAAEAAGARIHESTRALGHERGPPLRVVTPRGDVRARFVVYCGNAYLGAGFPELRRRIMGVGTYIIATEPLGAKRAAALIRNDAGVTDVNWVLDYFRRSADHRLLFGGRVSYSGPDLVGTGHATRRRMLAVFPQLADARIEYAWGGYADITMNRAPNFGRLAPDIYFLQGFSGHGIALTGIAGQLVAEAIAGQAERFDVFARIPHRDFPGGMALRRPALVLAMLYYRLRDLL